MADYPVALVDPADLLDELTPDVYDIGVVVVDVGDLLYEIDMTGPGGAQRSYVNRVRDSVAGDFVRWVTSEVDSAGASYPGPGTFGVDTSDFVVETVTYSRL